MNTFEALVFYRGVSANNPTDKPYIKTPRKDRKPKSSPAQFHQFADEWFLQKFGIPYRSQGLFVTSKILTASSYAATDLHIVRIIPSTTYTYCWSPKVSDLLFIAKDMANSSKSEVHQLLDEMEYCEDSLDLASQKGNEVMLFCEQFISIPIGLFNIQKPIASKIILPAVY